MYLKVSVYVCFWQILDWPLCLSSCPLHMPVPTMCANFWQALPIAASSCLLFHPSGYGRKSSMTLSHPVALAATLRPRPCLRVHICVIRLFLQPTRTCLSGDVFEEVKWTLFRVCRYRGQCMFAHTQAPAETHVSSLFFGHTDCVVWESNKLRVEGARVWNVQFLYIYICNIILIFNYL